MKTTPIALLAVATVAALLSVGSDSAGATSSVGAADAPVHVIVSVIDAHSPGDATALAARFDAEFGSDVVTTMALDDLDLITADVNRAGRAGLAALPEVKSISVSRGFTAALDVSVPHIGAAALHAGGLTGAGKAVVVIDSGVSSATPALAASPSHAASVVYEACFLNGADAPSVSGDGGQSTPIELCPDGTTQSEGVGSAQPCVTLASLCAHGTGVAGVIAAHESGSPYIGVAPDASIISLRVTAVIKRFGTGNIETYISPDGVLAALNRVVALSPFYDITSVNLSLGGSGAVCFDTAWQSVVSQLSALGIAVVAASGNGGSSTLISFPACLPGVVSVGASDSLGRIASFSDTSSLLDIVAPGGSVITATPTSFSASGYATEAGTSFSAPHISGVFALLDSTFPSFNISRMRNLLRSTGVMLSARPTGDPRIPELRFPEVRADIAESFVPFADATGAAFWIEPADWAKATGVSTGIDGVNFGALGTLNRAQAVTFLWRFMDRPVAISAATFFDIEPGRFYVQAVDWAAETGVTTGIPGNLFDPAGAVTRGQLATFMWRMVGHPAVPPTYSGSFSDVAPGIYYETAVDWMAANGITTGTSPGVFSPDNVVTRAQMVTFLKRLASTPGAWTGTVQPPTRALF